LFEKPVPADMTDLIGSEDRFLKAEFLFWIVFPSLEKIFVDVP
jgi:hypothetical protein